VLAAPHRRKADTAAEHTRCEGWTFIGAQGVGAVLRGGCCQQHNLKGFRLARRGLGGLAAPVAGAGAWRGARARGGSPTRAGRAAPHARQTRGVRGPPRGRGRAAAQGLGLVFVAVYQRALKLLYVDALLERLKADFSAQARVHRTLP
jgi:hypothetical protein